MKKIITLFASIIFISIIITSCSKTPPTNLVEVTAKDYYFHMQDSIPSGWTTFRFINQGHATHFFFLTLLPDGVNFQNYISDIGPAFSAAWDTLQKGATKAEAGALLGGLLPKNGTLPQNIWEEQVLLQ